MMELINNFHFLRPWLLLLALLPLILYGFYASGGDAQSSWRRIIDKKLLDFLLIKGSGSTRKKIMIAVLAGLISGALIAAGPSWDKREIPVLQKQNPVIIMLNMSSDMQETDIKPSRLERAKYKIKDFLNLLRGEQVALGVYTDEPFVIAPFTDDVRILQNLLEAISFDIMPSNGDRLDRAIELAVQRFEETGYNEGNLIVFAADVGQKFDLAIDAAKRALANGFKVNIIQTGISDNEKLQMIVKAGGGAWINLGKNDTKADDLAKEISQNNAQTEEGDNLSLQWIDGGWYLLVVPLLCCLMMFRKGILIVALVLITNEAYAGFFTNRNQDGLQAFVQQDYKQAAEDFSDNRWKGASFYRQGNYKEAYAYYALDNSTEGLYNQGNALAKAGKIEEAIAKYEEVLKLQPEHEDAKFNLEYLKQQKQQNQQNKNQSSQNNNSENDSQNGGQSQNSDENNQDNQDNQQNQDSSSGENNDEDNQQEQKQGQNSQSEGSSGGQSEQQEQNQESNGQNDNKDNQENPNAQSLSTALSEAMNDNQTTPQGEQSSSMMDEAEEGEDEDYDEKVQAKTLRYREIPEDAGGLLRAFIAREYLKNRYNEK